MDNIWSKNKYVNITINVLLFLMAANFLHYGYLLLPIICLILFIDNKCKFKVHNIKIFILLCLFGLSFFIFSYKLGFYSLIGMFLPMAYYIGSNIKNVNENKIIKLIYLLAIGMTAHILLNFGYDYFIEGAKIFSNKKHYDFWVMDFGSPTQTAVNYVFIVSILYYVFVYENNKKIRCLIIVLFIVCIVYELALARRTPILLAGISFIMCPAIDKLVLKNRNKRVNTFIAVEIVSILIMLGIGVYYINNYYNPWVSGESISIINRLLSYNFDSGRTEIVLNAIKIAPQHLWGGQEISTLFDLNIHELWLDTFDYAGIIPYILLIIYSIYCLFKMIETFKNNNLSKSFRLLMFALFICITIQMFLEPVITGSAVFLLSTIIIFTAVDSLNSK